MKKRLEHLQDSAAIIAVICVMFLTLILFRIGAAIQESAEDKTKDSKP